MAGILSYNSTWILEENSVATDVSDRLKPVAEIIVTA
jgi:hypothetical protein